jgi:hypothetical protein
VHATRAPGHRGGPRHGARRRGPRRARLRLPAADRRGGAGPRARRRVERAAAAIGIPVVLEGIRCPATRGSRTLSVTPDPGVIEVNVQPTASPGPELRRSHRDALRGRPPDPAHDREVRPRRHPHRHRRRQPLHPRRVDARRLAAAAPARPAAQPGHLLAAPPVPVLCLRGRFIGPTSQAPRVDEGRFETLYELEIAFAEMERAEARESGSGRRRTGPGSSTGSCGTCSPTSPATPTARSSASTSSSAPGSERGRLGLLELRGFEMPPHPRMALVQALLVRALVARFWEEPYAAPLVRWGIAPARPLPPAGLRAGRPARRRGRGERVAGRRHTAGAALRRRRGSRPSWSSASRGSARRRSPGCTSSCGQAIEPWHVLGEEVSQRRVPPAMSTPRSSGCRCARPGWSRAAMWSPATASPSRSWRPVGARGRSDGGGRALPRLGSVVGAAPDDRRAQRRSSSTWSTAGTAASLGGFTYHVTHPGGRSYDTYPVNAVAAESRRSSRFTKHGHSSGPVDIGGWRDAALLGPPGSEYPTTLDLRRFTPGNPPPAERETDN